MFQPGSRYSPVPDAIYTHPSGRQITYKRLRTFPTGVPVERLHVVADGDRFDLVSYTYYHDPLLFWRICDANRGFWPGDLLIQPGRQLSIPVRR